MFFFPALNLTIILNFLSDFAAFITLHLNGFAIDVWIGLNDINSEGRYLWTEGKGVFYTNWAKGFPTGKAHSYDNPVSINICRWMGFSNSAVELFLATFDFMSSPASRGKLVNNSIGTMETVTVENNLSWNF